MSLWRALIGSARGRPRYLSPPFCPPSPPPAFSSFILAKSEQPHLCSVPRIETPFHESGDVCARLNEHIWPGLEGFPPLVFAQRCGMPVEQGDDFWPSSSVKERLGSLNIKSLEEFSQILKQKKSSPIATTSAFAAGTMPLYNSGSSLEDTEALLIDFLGQNVHKQDEGPSSEFFAGSFTGGVPGFSGTEDLVMHADSVKRKRKKKMNKHKHRKLRRLARKSGK